MAFRASSLIPETALKTAKGRALAIKVFAVAKSTELVTATKSVDILGIADSIANFVSELNTIKSTPGLAEYAKDQENDQSYDVVAEFNALVASLDAVISTVKSTFPVDSGGFLLSETFNADGTRTPRTFTASQVATIKADLDTVVASID